MLCRRLHQHHVQLKRFSKLICIRNLNTGYQAVDKLADTATFGKIDSVIQWYEDKFGLSEVRHAQEEAIKVTTSILSTFQDSYIIIKSFLFNIDQLTTFSLYTCTDVSFIWPQGLVTISIYLHTVCNPYYKAYTILYKGVVKLRSWLIPLIHHGINQL